MVQIPRHRDVQAQGNHMLLDPVQGLARSQYAGFLKASIRVACGQSDHPNTVSARHSHSLCTVQSDRQRAGVDSSDLVKPVQMHMLNLNGAAGAQVRKQVSTPKICSICRGLHCVNSVSRHSGSLTKQVSKKACKVRGVVRPEWQETAGAKSASSSCSLCSLAALHLMHQVPAGGVPQP